MGQVSCLHLVTPDSCVLTLAPPYRHAVRWEVEECLVLSKRLWLNCFSDLKIPLNNYYGNIELSSFPLSHITAMALYNIISSSLVSFFSHFYTAKRSLDSTVKCVSSILTTAKNIFQREKELSQSRTSAVSALVFALWEAHSIWPGHNHWVNTIFWIEFLKSTKPSRRSAREGNSVHEPRGWGEGGPGTTEGGSVWCGPGSRRSPGDGGWRMGSLDMRTPAAPGPFSGGSVLRRCLQSILGGGDSVFRDSLPQVESRELRDWLQANSEIQLGDRAQASPEGHFLLRGLGLNNKLAVSWAPAVHCREAGLQQPACCH